MLTKRPRRIGVLWSGDHLFPHVPETIDMLRKRGMTMLRRAMGKKRKDSCQR